MRPQCPSPHISLRLWLGRQRDKVRNTQEIENKRQREKREIEKKKKQSRGFQRNPHTVIPLGTRRQTSSELRALVFL